MNKLAKKLLLFALVLTMSFSMVACGSDSDADNDREEQVTQEIEEDNIEVVSSEPENTSEPESTPEPTSTPEPEEPAYIAHPDKNKESFVIENSWYFMADATGEGTPKWFIYDIPSAEIMAETDINLDVQIRTGETKFWKQYRLQGNDIIDMSTGEKVFSLNDNQQFAGSICDGRIQVIETTSAFEGNTYAIGVLNMNGEWDIPLSSEYGFLTDDMIYKSPAYAGNGAWIWRDEGNEVSYLFGFPENPLVTLHEDGGQYGLLGSNLFYQNYNNFDYNVLDINTGNVSVLYVIEIVNDMDILSYDYDKELFCACKTVSNKDTYVVGNASGFLTEYDTSAYGRVTGRVSSADNLTAEHFFTVIQNTSGNYYLCLINADGNMEFEPVSCPSDDVLLFLTGQKAIAFSQYNNSVMIYDIATKEMVIRDDLPYSISMYVKDQNMFIVQGTHPEYGEGQYLVSLDDLDTLINPFE